MKNLDQAEALKTQEGRQLRKKLKQAGDIEIPMDEDFYDRLHDKIMASVEQTEIKPLSKLDSAQQIMKRHWRKAAPAARVASQLTMALALLAVISFKGGSYAENLWSSSHTVQMVQNEKQILNEALDAPEQFSTSLISYQSQNDFFLDVAAQSEITDSVAQLKEIIGEKAN